MNQLVIFLPDNESLAEELTTQLNAEMGRATFRRFPDGETYVRVETQVEGKEVIIVGTLNNPNEKILPLILLAETLKDLGARKVFLVAPYLPYMRQDRRFQTGEGITSIYFAKLLSSFVDGLVTIDPHLHRRKSLDEIYSIPTVVLHAAPLISRWILRNVKEPVLVGPDSESEQWVAAVAEGAGGAPHIVLEKVRRGDRRVDVSIPHVERWQGRTPVLVDDIISTARTMIETVNHLKEAGLGAPVCVGVHAVFAGNAYQELIVAGAKIITCDTIPHASNSIGCAEIVFEGVCKLSECV